MVEACIDSVISTDDNRYTETLINKEFYIQEIHSHIKYINSNINNLTDTSLVIQSGIDIVHDCIKELILSNNNSNLIDMNTYILSNELNGPMEKLQCIMNEIMISYKGLVDSFNNVNNITKKL